MKGLGRTILVAGAVAMALIAGWLLTTPSDAQLEIGDSVAGDLEQLATRTFDRFVTAAPGVADCIGTIRLEAAAELDDVAVYDQAASVVWVRVPATAPHLEASLVHEFAHHLEVACPSHREELRPRFLEAQAHPATTPWFGDVAWEQRPSEQYAEAVVEVVLGQRTRNQLGLRLEPEATRVVADWLAASD